MIKSVKVDSQVKEGKVREKLSMSFSAQPKGPQLGGSSALPWAFPEGVSAASTQITHTHIPLKN